MLATIRNGDVKKLAELMRQDPGFDVNKELSSVNGWTLLHAACLGGSNRYPVIPFLLAHPDINANVKDKNGLTPFYLACGKEDPSCVRELLKDSRVKVNEPGNGGHTPLWCAASEGHLDIIKW